jgi:hypothetical protein
MIERRGTDFAPWTVVHRASGLAVPVWRPYPGPGKLPPIQVANHRSHEEATKAAGEIDWDEVDRLAATPKMRATAKREAERRVFDAAYQHALTEARADRGPWPWEPDGLLNALAVAAIPSRPIDGQLELFAEAA